MIKESEAWRLTGEYLENSMHSMRQGLCHIMYIVLKSKALPNAFEYVFNSQGAIYKRLEKHLKLNSDQALVCVKLFSTYAYLPGTDREARILAAYWLMLECLEEEKENKHEDN